MDLVRWTHACRELLKPLQSAALSCLGFFFFPPFHPVTFFLVFLVLTPSPHPRPRPLASLCALLTACTGKFRQVLSFHLLLNRVIDQQECTLSFIAVQICCGRNCAFCGPTLKLAASSFLTWLFQVSCRGEKKIIGKMDLKTQIRLDCEILLTTCKNIWPF